MVKLMTGDTWTTVQGDNSKFSFKLDKTQFRNNIEEIRDEVNTLHRKFIKEQLKTAAMQTANNVRGKTVKERSNRRKAGPLGALMGGGTAPEQIANSLGFNFNYATKNEIAYSAGSYDRDEGLDRMSRFSSLRGIPTGIRAKKMKKRDPSLVEIYDVTKGGFEQLGIISGGGDGSGDIGGGKTADWKRKAESSGKNIFYALKGYGQGQNMTQRKGPKIRREGWQGVNAIATMERLFRNNINQKGGMLAQQLQAIKTKSAGQTTLGDF
tara:strand:+ start:1305 stop:2105 length:801 start_codon:yes stop_codon:yes gene_type:complete